MSFARTPGEPPQVPSDMGSEVVLVLAPESLTPWRRIVRRFRKNKVALAALAFVLGVVAAALAAHFLAPYSPTAQPGPLNSGPSAAHWLGTDDVGRDILSRLLHAARTSMAVSSLAIVFTVTLALPIGLTTAYAGGWLDGVTQRLMEALMTVPGIVLALVIAALLGRSTVLVALAIAIPFVPGFVRLIRAMVLAVREETFIEASRSVGVTSMRMIAKHIFPNVASPMIVQVALAFGYAELAEAGLSFLGFGPALSWGTMLSEAYNSVLNHQWQIFPPGACIFLVVLAFNLIADGLRDAMGRETFAVRVD